MMRSITRMLLLSGLLAFLSAAQAETVRVWSRPSRTYVSGPHGRYRVSRGSCRRSVRGSRLPPRPPMEEEASKHLAAMKKQVSDAMARDIWRREYSSVLRPGYGSVNPATLSAETQALLKTNLDAAGKQLAGQQEVLDAGRVSAPKAGPIDPRVLAQLKRMSEYLVGLRQFRVEAVDAREEVVAAPTRVHLQSRQVYDVKRPDRLRLRSKGERTDALLTFDGAQCRISDPVGQGDVVIPVKGDLPALFAAVEGQCAFTLPFSDLLYGDVYSRLVGSLSSARYLGVSTMYGHECHQLSCVSGGAEWQLWVAADGEPIPRRLLVRYRDEPNAPCYNVNFESIRPIDGETAEP